MTSTSSHDPDHLPALDARARAAADGLRRHVDAHLDADPAVALLPAALPPRRRGRILAIAAAAALLVGTVAVISQKAGDEGARVDLDEDGEALPDFEPGLLRPLGPHDGKDSIQLPVTATPNTGLHDGDEVEVSSPGFEPGERVGIVQCAKEAGGDSPEVRGGIDGCNIGNVQYADADEQGVATGSIAVRRVLTTPITGTVDCAAEANRCIVAMGALSDYDRSGGHGIEFAPGATPIELPTVTVLPTEDLADGDVVHVVADGLTPNSISGMSVCSSDPAACWQTGEQIEATFGEGGDTYNGVQWGLRVDGDGHLEGDVPVWRFLPGPEPGTYADCAVSRCSLRLEGETAPPTVPLHFTPGGEGPVAPGLSVEPADGLATGDEVVVRGKGFALGSLLSVSLCAAPAGTPPPKWVTCGTTGDPEVRVADDGTFRVDFVVPELGSIDGDTVCGPDGACSPVTTAGSGEGAVRCDGLSFDCYLTAEPYYANGPDDPGDMRPLFPPPPVLVTFR
jgi:hypothetical protein